MTSHSSIIMRNSATGSSSNTGTTSSNSGMFNVPSAPSPPPPIPPFLHAISGAIGGTIALFLLYPLERIRIEMLHNQKQQLQQQNHHHSHQHQQLVVSRSDINDTKAHINISTTRGKNYNTPEGDDDVEETTIEFTTSPLKISPKENTKASNLDDSWSFEVHVSKSKEDNCLCDDTNMDQYHDALSDEQQIPDNSTSRTNDDCNDDGIVVLSPQHDSRNSKSELLSLIMKLSLLLKKKKELYRGIIPIVITTTISNFLFFYMNEYIKQLLYKSSSSSSSIWNKILHKRQYQSLLSLCIAGIGNVLFTNPLYVIHLRITTGTNKYSTNLLKELLYTIFYDHFPSPNKQQQQQLLQHDDMNTAIRYTAAINYYNNLKQLWSGSIASFYLVSNPVIQFFMYEELKSYCIQHQQQNRNNHIRKNKSSNSSNHHHHHISPLQAFVIGAIAKAMATIVTYPLQVVQALQRLQQKQQQNEQASTAVGDKHHQGTTTNTNEIRAVVDDTEGKQSTTCVNTTTTNVSNTCNTYGTSTSASVLVCLMNLYHKHGIQKGWYLGIRTKLLQTVLTAAITFLSYEQIVQVLYRLYCHHRHRISNTR